MLQSAVLLPLEEFCRDIKFDCFFTAFNLTYTYSTISAAQKN